MLPELASSQEAQQRFVMKRLIRQDLSDANTT
jgi:hypothetical protein